MLNLYHLEFGKVVPTTLQNGCFSMNKLESQLSWGCGGERIYKVSRQTEWQIEKYVSLQCLSILYIAPPLHEFKTFLGTKWSEKNLSCNNKPALSPDLHKCSDYKSQIELNLLIWLDKPRKEECKNDWYWVLKMFISLSIQTKCFLELMWYPGNLGVIWVISPVICCLHPLTLPALATSGEYQ